MNTSPSRPCGRRGLTPHPGRAPSALDGAPKNLGPPRSLGPPLHRSSLGKARLKSAIEETRRLLGIPEDYLLGIVPGSDTGAMEMALWSLLGPRSVQLLAFDSFGKDWVTDVVKQLRLQAEVLEAPYGRLPDLAKVRSEADLVFTWNGTTSGVRVPNADFIAADRAALTICDATSACFAQAIEWAKLDVATLSWQKALGGAGRPTASSSFLTAGGDATESHTPA